jgi:hypothetical protein
MPPNSKLARIACTLFIPTYFSQIRLPLITQMSSFAFSDGVALTFRTRIPARFSYLTHYLMFSRPNFSAFKARLNYHLVKVTRARWAASEAAQHARVTAMLHGYYPRHDSFFVGGGARRSDGTMTTEFLAADILLHRLDRSA